MDSVGAFKFSCPGCGQHLKARPEEAGQVTVCPLCARRLVVPQAPAEGTKLMISAALAEGRVNRTPAPSDMIDSPGGRGRPMRAVLWIAGALVGLAIIVTAAIVLQSNGFGYNQGNPSGNPVGLWTTNFTELRTEEAALRGRLHGWDFSENAATWRGTKLILHQGGQPGARTLELQLDLPLKGGELVPGKRFEASEEHGPLPNPVLILWEDDTAQKQTRQFSSNYLLKLEITAVTDTQVSGRIHLCLPDDQRSWVAGRFDADIRTKR